MCRLFDRSLADGINYFLYQNRLISATQCGFVKWLSMDVQLLHCTNLPVKSIYNKRFVDTVYYIDFAKALIRPWRNLYNTHRPSWQNTNRTIFTGLRRVNLFYTPG